jgi:hypothetical protein
MKRLIVILALMLSAIAANAQQRILPMMDINRVTYEAALEIITVMERASFIERMEGIRMDADRVTTPGGEILVMKEKNSIKIIHVEFTIMLDEHIANPNRRWHDIDSIRTELIIQNAEMFNYISGRLSANRRIKNMYIKMDPRTGGAYIRIDYYNL